MVMRAFNLLRTIAIVFKIILLVAEPSLSSTRLRFDFDAAELVYRCSRKCLRYMEADGRDPAPSVQCRRGCYYGITTDPDNCISFCGGSQACVAGCIASQEYWLADSLERTIEDDDDSQESEIFVDLGAMSKGRPNEPYVPESRKYHINPFEGDRRFAHEGDILPSQAFPVVMADIRLKQNSREEIVKRKRRRRILLLSMLCTLLGSVLAAAIVLTTVYRRRRKDVDNAYSRLEEKMEGAVDDSEYGSDEHC